MQKSILIGFVLASWVYLGPTADAQVRESDTLLRPDLQGKVLASDTLSQFRTRTVPGGRMDIDEGVFRARYHVNERVTRGLRPADAAIEHLAQSGRRYGIERPHENLIIESVISGPNAGHVLLRQRLRGIPVYGREVKVSLNKGGQPTMVINGYAPHLERVDDFDTTPRITESQARRIVQTASERGLRTSDPELVVYPSKPPRLAWNMRASMEGAAVEYDALVDAETGDVIHLLDVTLHARGALRPLSPGQDAGSASRRNSRLDMSAPNLQPPTGSPASPTSGAQVDGTGWVFDPDPLTSAGVEYGGEYADNADADSPSLTDQLFTVPLREITLRDGRYWLEGPYVAIEPYLSDSQAPSGRIAPSETSPDGFTYRRANDAFEAVMAYYHIDKSQRYVQSLDVGFPIKEEPILVNPHGTHDDNSYFDLNNLIRFGTGGIDDAEDADVIWHEYAHVLLDYTTPSLYATFEGKALHEGWSDYWAASYSRYLSEEDGQIPEHDWRRVYTWDGNVAGTTNCWPGRTLDHMGHYPDDMSYNGPSCQIIQDHYQWGLHWGTTLMSIYPHVGRNVLDRLTLASHAYLSRNATLADAAQALIQADEDLYSAAHNDVIIHYLDQAGYVDEELYGPVLSHEPLGATEDVGGSAPVTVRATATTADVDSVLVFYGTSGDASNRIILEPMGDDNFAGELPLPEDQATVTYYVEAVDVEGRRRRLPAGAPAETYSFDVGPDEEPPLIEHAPADRHSIVGWPADVYALVDDNLSVDSVWVEFSIESTGGAVLQEGSFGLMDEGDTFFGRFPATPGKVEAGGHLEYSIHARDASQAGNVAMLPSGDAFRVPFVEEGVIRAYDFEGINQGIAGTGTWERGAPGFGLHVAHSGATAWGTNPAAAYSDVPDRSMLEIPSLNLSGVDQAYLIFWHWHDFEHDGDIEPGIHDPAGGLWDGANVKVSVDGGTFEVVEPEGRYNGAVSEQYGNPLGGEEAFGGYSFGWRREVVPLPTGEDVRIRFDFGSDEGNENEALFYAGWYIDDVMITTMLPEDNAQPQALTLPEDRTIRIAGSEGPPQVALEVADDTGLEAVISQYEITSAAGENVSGTIRLAMSGSDLSVFAGPVVPPRSFEPGDRIEYRLLLRDFDGNESVYGSPFVVEFRAEQQSQALRSVVATGAWHQQGSGWVASASANGPVSSLVLQPFTPSANSDSTVFLLEHSFELYEGAGGNVKVSIDDGRSWTVLTPAGGYPSTFEASDDMAGQGVFTGAAEGSLSRFDLSPFQGSELRLRVDLLHARPLASAEQWSVHAAAYRALSPDDEFDTRRELALHANFPDPVLDRTTVSYTIPERMPVRISVYDVLGRRVGVVRHVEHDAGTYTLTYDAGALANGVYLLHLETTMGTRTEQMVVAR